MPELPEVESYRQYFEQNVLRKKIVRVEITDVGILRDTDAADFMHRVSNCHFTETYRHGKFMFAKISANKWVLFHFGMTGDFRFERAENASLESKAFTPSIFPHWIHRINYRCDACHDTLFTMELGATPITMELINKGESCGVCHNGKAAFASNFENCHRCHTSTE